MYQLYSQLIEKVARTLKVSPNISVYLIYLVGLLIFGIAMIIEQEPQSYAFQYLYIVLAVLGCGFFLTVFNLIVGNKDWFLKRSDGYMKNLEDLERSEMAKYMYEKWHPKD